MRTLPCVTTSSMEPLPTTTGGAEAAPEAAAAAAGPAAVGDALASASAGLLAGLLASVGAALAGAGLWPCAFLSSIRRAPSAMPSAATVLVRARA